MPRFKRINFHQNRPKNKLFLPIKYKIFEQWVLRIAFPQILEHSRTKNSNIATKTFYYIRTNIIIKDFVYAVCIRIPS